MNRERSYAPPDEQGDAETRGRLRARASLDDESTAGPGRTPALRWVYTHMIEEFARHNGHADLLRQRIDGATGS